MPPLVVLRRTSYGVYDRHSASPAAVVMTSSTGRAARAGVVGARIWCAPRHALAVALLDYPPDPPQAGRMMPHQWTAMMRRLTARWSSATDVVSAE